LIVTCEQCATQFRLDDAKIPSAGARVRCSRCQHAFFIEPPHVDDHVRVDGLTRDALGSGEGFDSSPESPALGDEGEADWKFNEDAPLAEESDSERLASADPDPAANLVAARDAVNDLLGTEPSVLERASADLAVEDLGGPDLDSGDLGLELAEPSSGPALAISEPSDPMPEFGEARDMSDPIGMDAPIGSSSAEGDSPEGDESVAPGESSAGESTEFESVVESLTGEDIDDDLGSPRNWDFFADGEEDPEPEGAKTAVARVGLIPRWKLLEQEQEQARQLELSELEAVAAASESDIRHGPASRALGKAGQGFGWFATLALVAAGVWSTLGPGPIGATRPAAQQILGDLEVEVLASSWIDNAVAGPIYVVSGRLRGAASGEPVVLGGLGIQLLDETGAPLDVPAMRIAKPRPYDQLRENPPAAIAHGIETEARSFAQIRLRTGDAVPFQAVFAELPPEATRFRLIATPRLPEIPAPPPTT
jgi:predicted Zn finger-like uncharacterized protein